MKFIVLFFYLMFFQNLMVQGQNDTEEFINWIDFKQDGPVKAQNYFQRFLNQDTITFIYLIPASNGEKSSAGQLQPFSDQVLRDVNTPIPFKEVSFPTGDEGNSFRNILISKDSKGTYITIFDRETGRCGNKDCFVKFLVTKKGDVKLIEIPREDGNNPDLLVGITITNNQGKILHSYFANKQYTHGTYFTEFPELKSPSDHIQF